MPVWPDNWRVLMVFASIGPGAWNVGPSGAIGIRPETFRELRLLHGISAPDWRAMYPDVMAMEAAALDAMRESA